MKKAIVLLCCMILWIHPAQAESVLLFDYIDVKENQSQEYQTMYLAGLCASCIQSHDTYENITHCRAICSQISIRTTEAISYDLFEGEKTYIRLTDEISFSDNISVRFQSDYIDLSILRRYLLPSTEFTENSAEYMTIQTEQSKYSILQDKFISCFNGVKTTNASLVLRSPYISEDLQDVVITRFNKETSIVNGNKISIPVMDDFDTWKEYLEQDEKLPWNK